MRILFIFVSILLLSSGCGERAPLPIIGQPEMVDGKKVYPTIRDFKFYNQDSNPVTNQTFDGKVYVANYFFTTCPDICPPVSREMLKIYDHFKNENRIGMLSHSIDTKYDSIPVLKRYAVGLEVEAPKWNFVTGNDEEIFEIAYDYKVNAVKDDKAPTGFDHDDLIILVDKNRHIRGFAHALEDGKTEEFIEDIEFLLKSEY